MATAASKKLYEISVVGAGPVGLAFLAALSKSSFYSNKDRRPFLLIDSMKPQITFPNSPDEIPRQRVLAVSRSTKQLLDSVGAWEKLTQNRIQPYYNMQIWETQGTGSLDLNDNNKPVGYIIEYDNIVQSLMQVINDHQKVDIISPAKLKSFNQKDDEFIKMHIQHEKEEINNIQTRLLVGSDGNKSQVKETSKIGTFGWSYNQMGIVCTVQHSTKSTTAYQRYQRNGLPLALLPLWDNYSSIVWSVTLEDYQYLMKLSDSEFVDELNNTYQQKSIIQTPSLNFNKSNSFQRPPLIDRILNKRMAFPFQSLQSQRYIGNRIALIGDAAHSIHPQTGQGMNMGMNDAALLANNVLINAKSGNDIGSLQALDSYESQAKLMNYSTSMGNEAIMKTYQMNLLTIVRNMGVSFANNFDFFKSMAVQQAGNHLLGPTKFEWNN